MAKYSFDDIRPSRPRKAPHVKGESELFPKTLHDDPDKKSVPIRINKQTGKREEENKTTEVIFSRKEESPHLVLWGIVSIVLLVLFFSVAGLFAGATITVTPKAENISVDAGWKAALVQGVGDIVFQTMSIPLEKSIEIPATGEQDVERKASGTIIVYNDYSATSQRLVKNTRFQNTDGKIYKLNTSITVPGKKTVNGAPVPGSVETVVYAEAPGDSYNIDLSDFTLPGFKGTPQYDKFYARSKTAMTGGFVGVEKIASPADLAGAEKQLSEDLTSELTQKAFAEKPAEFLLFNDALFISKQRMEQAKESPAGKVILSMKGVLRANLIPEKDLARLVAEKYISGFDGGDIDIANPETLSFIIKDRAGLAPEDDIFHFALSGNAKLVWALDEQGFKEKLVGTPRKTFNTILLSFPYIERAEASLRPFWKRTFPNNPDDIKIQKVSQ